jgi:hypothetical protein
MRRIALVVVFFLSLAVLVLPSPAVAAESCRAINATGTGSGAPAEPGDPPNVIRTQAQLSDAGLLQGTTTAVFTITGVTDTGITFAGPLTITTNRGTVVVDLTGTLDVTTGQFLASGPIVASTGKLSGATGSLTLSGEQDLTDPAGRFTETVSGSICVDLGARALSQPA